MSDPSVSASESCCKYVVSAQTKIAQTIVLVDIAQRIDVQLCDASKMLDAQSKSRKNGSMLRRTIAEFFGSTEVFCLYHRFTGLKQVSQDTSKQKFT